MKSKISHFLKKIRIPFFLLSLILSIVGSYQLYHGKYTNLLKEISVILYSVTKLFTFLPLNGITNEGPLAYEIAIWMAPISTVLGIFSVFKGIYTQIKLAFLHVGRQHLVVMGAGEEAIQFMKNISDSKDKTRIICLLDEADKADEARLNKLNVLTVKVDYSNPDSVKNQLALKDHKIGDMGIVVCFEPEPMNYGKITTLYEMLGNRSPHIKVYIQSENDRFKEMVQFKMDELINFDIHYFNIKSLLVSNLLNGTAFKVNKPGKMSQPWKDITFQSYRDIAEKLGSYHILIVGFTEIAEEFLNQASNIFTLNPIKRMKVTIIDKNVDEKFEKFSTYRRHIDRVIDVNLIENTLNYKTMVDKLNQAQAEAFSMALFSAEKLEENVLNLDWLIDSLEKTPIAFYAENQSDAVALIESFKLRHNNLISFGDCSEVLTKSIIIDELLLEKAKVFNAGYNRYAAEMMGWEIAEESVEEQWMKLSNIKKESNEFQVGHQKTKKLILGKFTETKDNPDRIEEIISCWRHLLTEKSVSEQVDLVESDPYINYMTALEHKRWSNFYYMRDFEFNEEKNEIKKQHDCLIDDWDEFMGGKHREKAIYDTLSTLVLED